MIIILVVEPVSLQVYQVLSTMSALRLADNPEMQGLSFLLASHLPLIYRHFHSAGASVGHVP